MTSSESRQAGQVRSGRLSLEYQWMLISDAPPFIAGDGALAWAPAADVGELATMLRALADPRRLTILRLLAQQETCVCEFEEVLGWPQNLISHHLGALRRAGLVVPRRDGQWVYYSLAPEQVARLHCLLADAIGDGELPPEARYGAAPRRCPPSGP
jgi:ArsR family transcriptional regulator